MRNIFLLVLLICSSAFPQENKSPDKLNLFSPSNIKKFGDFLFCQGDYLRASEQYLNYLTTNFNDTVEFKLGLAYSQMGKFDKSAGRFSSIPNSSSLYLISKLEYLKDYFLTGDFSEYRIKYDNLDIKSGFKYLDEANSLYNFSYLFTDKTLPDESNFLAPFQKPYRDSVKKFYKWKLNPPYKSEITAAVLSAVVPGLGKIYTHQYSDGIFAFLATGICGYLAYADFNAHHYFRAWLFTGLTAGFYGGNVYGAAASAQLYNAKINFDFTHGLKVFLDEMNFFIPQINFCK